MTASPRHSKSSPRAKSVQAYLDEAPLWGDGTPVGSMPMTAMQWRIWRLAAIGKLFEGIVIFMGGVAMPLIVRDFGLAGFEQGLLAAASLFGILVGAVGLGGLTDLFGRKRMFVFEMLLLTAFLVGVVVAPNFWTLLFCLFGVGLALGCDYPTANMIISESVPSVLRGRLVLGAFAFQALGAVTGTLMALFILSIDPTGNAWRWMYALVILPALLVAMARFRVPESAVWLAGQGNEVAAEQALTVLLQRQPKYPGRIILAMQRAAARRRQQGFASLFSPRYIRATILASIPWFLQDLSTYGIGIFTPTILLTAFGQATGPASSMTGLVLRDEMAAKGAALIDLPLLLGIVLAIFLVDKVGSIRLQVLGFAGCAVGLALAAVSGSVPAPWSIILVFAGFMGFMFMNNLGPNSQTGLIAAEAYPAVIRGRGSGFAAAIGKCGAVLTAFCFPLLLSAIGTSALLVGLVGTSLLGALITWHFRIHTGGVDLEVVHGPDA